MHEVNRGRRRTGRQWLLAVVLLPALAFAHSKLEASLPAAGSVIAAMPERIELRFSAPIRVTSLVLRAEAGGEEHRLDVSAAAPGTTIQVTAPRLLPGAWRLTWRGAGGDGHIMSGEVRFTIEAP